MLSVVIPTLDAEEGLIRTLASLVPAAAEGVIREVVVVDGGSQDGTEKVAEAAGCQLLHVSGCWGEKVATGIAAARRSPWLMVLQPNILLEGEWFREVAAFADRAERTGGADRRAATFRIAFDAFGWQARLAESTIGVASSVFGLPLPQQGLVVSRRLWDRARRDGPLRDHRHLVSRIGRRSIHVLRARAIAISTVTDGQSLPPGGAIARHALAALGLPLRVTG
ncbi:glycosyltransferase [Prosthecomicrobium sp. N25]|uniref:glycosyltransferase n=1 Tax=Prosthecomicrobium sp. N25 TaxID=3129254 RepID=UPI00307704AF